MTTDTDPDRLVEKDCDLFLNIGIGQWPGLASEPLVTFVGSLLCAPEMADGRRPPKSIEEVPGYPVLSYHQSPDLWQRVFASFNRSDLKVGEMHNYDDADVLLHAAAQGLGIAVGTRPFATPFLASGALIDPFNRIFSTGDGIYLIYQADSHLNTGAAAFANWIRQVLPPMYDAACRSEGAL